MKEKTPMKSRVAFESGFHITSALTQESNVYMGGILAESVHRCVLNLLKSQKAVAGEIIKVTVEVMKSKRAAAVVHHRSAYHYTPKEDHHE